MFPAVISYLTSSISKQGLLIIPGIVGQISQVGRAYVASSFCTFVLNGHPAEVCRAMHLQIFIGTALAKHFSRRCALTPAIVAFAPGLLCPGRLPTRRLAADGCRVKRQKAAAAAGAAVADSSTAQTELATIGSKKSMLETEGDVEAGLSATTQSTEATPGSDDALAAAPAATGTASG